MPRLAGLATVTTLATNGGSSVRQVCTLAVSRYFLAMVLLGLSARTLTAVTMERIQHLTLVSGELSVPSQVEKSLANSNLKMSNSFSNCARASVSQGVDFVVGGVKCGATHHWVKYPEVV